MERHEMIKKLKSANGTIRDQPEASLKTHANAKRARRSDSAKIAYFHRYSESKGNSSSQMNSEITFSMHKLLALDDSIFTPHVMIRARSDTIKM